MIFDRSAGWRTRVLCAWLVLASLAAWRAPLARADVMAYFPGVAALVKQSDVVAIVRIDTRVILIKGEWQREKDFKKSMEKASRKGEMANFNYDSRWGSTNGLFDAYDCDFVQTIKSTTETLKLKPIELCHLTEQLAPLSVAPGITAFDAEVFVRSQRQNLRDLSDKYALVFFHKTKSIVWLLHNPNRDVYLSSFNGPGGVILLPEALAKEKLSGANAEEKVRNLLTKLIGERTSHKKKNAQEPRP